MKEPYIKGEAAPRPCGVREPVHAWTLYVREPGDLQKPPAGSAEAGAVGEGLWPYCQRVRF
jgi:hypothetical protein